MHLAYGARHNGNVLRAWLADLDVDQSMIMQQKELFKACQTLGWPSALWRVQWCCRASSR